MIQPMNPFSASKTAEIMSRYRPIAPKPELPMDPMYESEKIRQSPYLRTLWPQLQARPTRTRKRGRIASISPATIKRTRTSHLLGFSSPPKNLSLHGFAPPPPPPRQLLPYPTPETFVRLPLVPYPPPSIPVPEKVTDSNTVAKIPEEKDFLKLLQQPPVTRNVITPQPVRPVGSSISVGSISIDTTNTIPEPQVLKKPEEVEDDVESDTLPAVISDSNNRVRLVNSAYKEMVGQPECSWLDSISMVTTACKRISGEVMLHLSDTGIPASCNGFSCWVNIVWGSGEKKNLINAFCDVNRLSCESKDYLFTWRFHTRTREPSSSQSTA